MDESFGGKKCSNIKFNKVSIVLRMVSKSYNKYYYYYHNTNEIILITCVFTIYKALEWKISYGVFV